MHKVNKSKEHRASRMYLGLGLIAAPAVVSGVVLSSAHTHAVDTVVDNVNINVPLSCSVSASGMDSHNETIANGTYVDDIGTTTMNIICNDNAGFSIYATGFTGNEIGATNSNKLVGTAASGNATIDTGTATSAGDPDVSNWAMKLEADAYDTYPITILSDYDYYHTVPGSYVKVATRLAGTDVGEYAEGATMTSTYAAYISKTQGADTYSGKVKYVLVHPNTAPAPISLYLQNTAAVAAAVPNIGDSTLAKDIRDDKTYRVGKLEDGNIWLLDNLELDLTAANASTTITASNTNASATSLNALFNGVEGGGADGNLAQAAVTNENDYWDEIYTEPVIRTLYNGRTVSDITGASVGGDWTVGTYYNYCAASAGSYCYDSSSAVGDATEDICPSGWRLPTGGYQGEYDVLYGEYQSESDPSLAFITALRVPFTGQAASYEDAYTRVGNYGYFLSSSLNYGSVSGLMTINGEYASLSTSQDIARDKGNSVRCVMDSN